MKSCSGLDVNYLIIWLLVIYSLLLCSDWLLWFTGSLEVKFWECIANCNMVQFPYTVCNNCLLLKHFFPIPLPIDIISIPKHWDMEVLNLGDGCAKTWFFSNSNWILKLLQEKSSKSSWHLKNVPFGTSLNHGYMCMFES